MKVTPMPEDIAKLGIEGIHQIWKNANLKGIKKSYAQKLLAATQESIGMKHGVAAAKLELNVL